MVSAAILTAYFLFPPSGGGGEGAECVGGDGGDHACDLESGAGEGDQLPAEVRSPGTGQPRAGAEGPGNAGFHGAEAPAAADHL